MYLLPDVPHSPMATPELYHRLATQSEIVWPSWEEHQRRVEAQREQHRKFATLFRDQSK